MRQIVLDTETTGLEPKEGHRIIEIGCVEVIDRRLTRNTFHQYLQPDREIDAGAVEVHGITNEFLRDKPRFAEVAEDFLAYRRGRRADHPQRRLRRRLPRPRAGPVAPAGPAHRRPVRGHRHPGHGAQPPPRPAQQPRRAVQALRRGQLPPRPARGPARRRDPRRRLSGHDRRPGQPAPRRPGGQPRCQPGAHTTASSPRRAPSPARGAGLPEEVAAHQARLAALAGGTCRWSSPPRNRPERL